LRTPMLLAGLLTLTVAVQVISAQEPGTRVRVRDDVTEVIGTLVRLDPDWIVVRPDALKPDSATMADVAIPIGPGTVLETSMGEHHNAGRGALIGFGVGLAGALVAYLSAEEGGWIDREFVLLVAGVTYGGTGALIGALIGHATTTERWAEVPLVDQAPDDADQLMAERFLLGVRIRF